MALQRTIIKQVYGQNINLENTYNKIMYIAGDKTLVDFTVLIQDSTRQYDIETKSYVFTPNVEEGSENFIKQAYEYLKTLDEFVNAIDC